MTRFARHPDGRKKKHEASSWQEMKAGNQAEQTAGDQPSNHSNNTQSAPSEGSHASQDTHHGGEGKTKLFTKPKGIVKNKERKPNVPKKASADMMKKGLCFNCGQKGHRVSECPNPSDGYRDNLTCRACNGKGHKSFSCPNQELKTKYEARVQNRSQHNKGGGKFTKDFKANQGIGQFRSKGFKKKFDENDEEKGELRTMWKKVKRSDQRRVKRQQQEEDSRACFKCRQFGHMLADCPEAEKDIEQGAGICFKCGSTEHAIAKCPVKLPKGKFPYAKCFICGETGHLSRQCPDNPRGLYPNGGCCDQCGAVDHLKRDCPEYQASVGVGGLKLGMLKQAGSIDSEDQLAAEIAAKKKVKPLESIKKPKVVKF